MKTWYLILYIIAGLCFLLAAASRWIKLTFITDIGLIATGLLAWVLVPLIEEAKS